MRSLNSDENIYLQYKLLNYSELEIQQFMDIDSIEYHNIEWALQLKGISLRNNEQIIIERDDRMPDYIAKKPELTKTEFLKLKKNSTLEKDICKQFGISKSTLIKNKQRWGLDQPRIKLLKEKVIAIQSMPTQSNVASENEQQESEILELRNMITVQQEKISQMEKEREVIQVQRRMEREAFLILQDILRAEINDYKVKVV
jgi:hypothetical protein